MPTARELLEQAEALMRRDRMATLASDDDFPLLTDAVADPLPPETAAPLPMPASANDIVVSPPAETSDAALLHPSPAPAPALAPQPEPAIARLDFEEGVVGRDQQGEPSIWSVPPGGAVTVTETGPDSLSPLLADAPGGARTSANDGDALWRDGASDGAPEIVETVSAETVVSGEASLVDRGEGIVAPIEDFPLDATLDATRWNLMAEDIRMQVLQRIDIFTDTGLREQLNQRLQPVVDRASADLVAAINQHVGQILREYVAEAIEREIEKWRQEPR
jgi:hypothetical protein